MDIVAKARKENYMTLKRKTTALILAAFMAVTAAAPAVSAETSEGNVGCASGVTEEMCSASFWNDRSGVDSSQILMTRQEIAELNSQTIAAEGAHMYDLINGISETCDADSLRKSLAEAEVTTKDLYIDGQLYRYLGSPEVDESARTGLTARFSDGDEIDAYAVDAVAWAVEKGIITGTDAGTLNPGSTAVRAQLAVMLQRLYEGPLKAEENENQYS